MACCGHSPCFGFGLFLLILSLILDVIGVGSPYWILGSVNGEKVYMGLWQMCTSGSIVGYEFSGCTDFDEVPDWFKAVRGFGMLGILLLLIAILTAFVKICLKDRSCVLIISIILSFMAAVCNVVSVSVFAEKYYDIVKDSSIFSFHFAFVFVVLSIITSGIAGICMIVEVSKRSSYSSI
ncbi:uncharacterized protein LOC111116459 [Crassostrea virginica]